MVATNIEEQLANTKATLERLTKESLEKDAQIKRQSEQIGTLMKKLKKQLFKSSTKGLEGEESDKESKRSKDSDDERIKKMESSLGLMSVEHIQSLIANAVKAQLEGGPDAEQTIRPNLLNNIKAWI